MVCTRAQQHFSVPVCFSARVATDIASCVQCGWLVAWFHNKLTNQHRCSLKLIYWGIKLVSAEAETGAETGFLFLCLQVRSGRTAQTSKLLHQPAVCLGAGTLGQRPHRSQVCGWTCLHRYHRCVGGLVYTGITGVWVDLFTQASQVCGWTCLHRHHRCLSASVSSDVCTPLPQVCK